MIELLNHVKPLFCEQEIEKINRSTDSLFTVFENHAYQTEEFLLYCKHGNINPKDLHGFIKGRNAYYWDGQPIQEAIKEPFNTLRFFHEEFPKGFFEILKLPEVLILFRLSPWKYSFSDEEQKKLTKQVETDMLQLRGEKPDQDLVDLENEPEVSIKYRFK